MWPTPKVAFLLLWAHALLVKGSPLAADAEVLGKRACPDIHVFGARETTAPPGYGTAGTVVNLILQAYPGATAEAINYPACGGQASCGGVQYGDSARQGTAAVATAVNNFYQQCPTTQLVLVGYSQGAQIMDNAVCGGPDNGAGITTTASPISAGALAQIKAVIEMGSPRFVAGLPYDVGTCTAQGFDARPSGYVCGGNQGSKIQSYCDSTDPYCCTGNDANSHQQYANKYGQQALAFIESKLGSSSSGGSGGSTGGSGGSTGGSCSALWGQCGGQGWTGPTCCSQGTCKAQNQWYSQCLN
ncbi:d6ba6dd3-247f-404f-b3bc-6f6234169548 [Thermothielavioides terrestris]|uniref:Carbohydrate esterase family 5 protein n=2 Tax=Thermothielavioides terrestris TaxID=2587410 RepID=G2R5H0_THETT|nr:carbohydrate esterase family 5 protein [Thermothielavioides terrestris NRRL 8126]AEO67461.1 carbohydrate esterase family 5 protein [Thermothielavioides terrestris NRRL 8126]SPQ25587.1 d6ba6dd3-247f-404f-b3bc-6f6234169548 [Thermothielavioides terrestris]